MIPVDKPRKKWSTLNKVKITLRLRLELTTLGADLGYVANSFYYKELKRGTLGLHYENGIIEIDISQMDNIKEIVEILRHEYRHEWQQKNFSSLYYWFAKHPDYLRRDPDFYFYSLIEMDARKFAKYGRGLDSVLNKYTIEDFEHMYRDGTLISEMKKIERRYNVPEE